MWRTHIEAIKEVLAWAMNKQFQFSNNNIINTRLFYFYACVYRLVLLKRQNSLLETWSTLREKKQKTCKEVGMVSLLSDDDECNIDKHVN